MSRAVGRGPSVKRRLFNLAAVGSLLLLVATSAAWFLSYRYPIQFYRMYVLTRTWPAQRLQADVGFDLANGRVGFFKFDERHTRARVDQYRELGPSIQWQAVPGHYLQGKPTCLGFGKGTLHSRNRTALGSWVIVPIWSLWLVTSALPVLRVTRDHRERVMRRREARGACPTCGYDLRATPERCPECGGVPVATT